MELDARQREELFETGLVRLPGIVPQELVHNALRAINGSLGEQGIDPDQLPIFRARSYCPEVAGSDAILDLYRASPLESLAESAIGRGQVRPVHGGQIALRFPQPGPPREPGPHVDGMYTPTNGVPEGTIANFTALIGVFLSDIPHEYMGNFAVWPGSHRSLERYFQEHGPQTLLDGLPPVELGSPKQVTGRAGDAVLCHYQLVHGITGNSSPFIRYAIFFRLTHVDHDSLHWECMTDIWREWAGMQETARSAASA